MLRFRQIGMRKQSLLVVGILILVAVGAQYGGVDFTAAARDLWDACGDVLKSMLDFITGLFRMT